MDTVAPPLPGVILAGGSGSRLGGICKPLLRLRDGRSVIARLLACCREAGIAPLAVNANDPAPYADLGLPVLPDRRHGIGPLAGIEAALLHAQGLGAAAVLVLAGDLPCIGADDLRRLADAWQAQGRTQVAWSRLPQERQHPLCAVVATAALAALTPDDRAVHRFWQRIGAGQVWFDDEAPFANLNTPEDLARWGITPSDGTR